MKIESKTGGLTNEHVTRTPAFKLYKKFVDPTDEMKEETVLDMWGSKTAIERNGFMFVSSLSLCFCFVCLPQSYGKSSWLVTPDI